MSSHETAGTARPEFSRTVAVQDVTDGGIGLAIEANAAECAALARRFGVLGLGGVRADLRLRPQADGGVMLEGRAEAEVEQTCVITGEPVKSSVASAFSVRYISPVIGTESLEAEEFDVLEEDTEPLPADVIDVGEVVAQYLSLAIDPYPRKPGAEIGAVELTPDGPVAGTERANPFAVLKKLRDKG